MRKLKTLLLVFFTIIILGLFMIFISNYLVENVSTGKTYSSLDCIPKNKIGLVLGTSKHLTNGKINLYFKYRIEATVKLFKSKKIEFILISGDNGEKYYNEPLDFKDELIANGIPPEKIFLDYAGFRTLDSVLRANKVFGLGSFTVISQKFHNQRAIYLAEKHDISVIGFNAENVNNRYGYKVEMREYLARTKAVLDIILGTKPKFLGDKINIQ